MILHGGGAIFSPGTRVKILTVPDNTVVEIKSLIISNDGTSPASVSISNGDGSDTNYDFGIVTVVVPAKDTLVLDEKALAGVRAFKDIYALSTGSNVYITIVADAK